MSWEIPSDQNIDSQELEADSTFKATPTSNFSQQDLQPWNHQVFQLGTKCSNASLWEFFTFKLQQQGWLTWPFLSFILLVVKQLALLWWAACSPMIKSNRSIQIMSQYAHMCVCMYVEARGDSGCLPQLLCLIFQGSVSLFWLCWLPTEFQASSCL